MTTAYSPVDSKGCELKRGMFAVTLGINGLRLRRAAYSQVKKFVEHYVRHGYTLVDTPCYQLIPAWEVGYKSAGVQGDIALWVPESKGLHPDHPWKIPDADQYQCWAWFYRQPQLAVVDLPDAYATRHGLPVGFKEV